MSDFSFKNKTSYFYGPRKMITIICIAYDTKVILKGKKIDHRKVHQNTKRKINHWHVAKLCLKVMHNPEMSMVLLVSWTRKVIYVA